MLSLAALQSTYIKQQLYLITAKILPPPFIFLFSIALRFITKLLSMAYPLSNITYFNFLIIQHLLDTLISVISHIPDSSLSKSPYILVSAQTFSAILYTVSASYCSVPENETYSFYSSVSENEIYRNFTL